MEWDFDPTLKKKKKKKRNIGFDAALADGSSGHGQEKSETAATDIENQEPAHNDVDAVPDENLDLKSSRKKKKREKKEKKKKPLNLEDLEQALPDGTSNKSGAPSEPMEEEDFDPTLKKKKKKKRNIGFDAALADGSSGHGQEKSETAATDIENQEPAHNDVDAVPDENLDLKSSRKKKKREKKEKKKKPLNLEDLEQALPDGTSNKSGAPSEPMEEETADVYTKSEVVEDPYAKLKDKTVVLSVSLVSNSVLNFIDVKPSILGSTRRAFQLWAANDKYITYDSSKTGKWMLFVEPQFIDAIWFKILASIIRGALWKALVLHNVDEPSRQPGQIVYPIMVYTVDYTDLDDVIRVLDYLETTGLASRGITYKTDEQTRAGIYKWKNNGTPWIYCSSSIRKYRDEAYKKSKNIPIVEFEKYKVYY